jgi:hypothetical protein
VQVTSLDPIAEAEEADLVGVVDLGVEGVQSVMILLLSFRVHSMNDEIKTLTPEIRKWDIK